MKSPIGLNKSVNPTGHVRSIDRPGSEGERWTGRVVKLELTLHYREGKPPEGYIELDGAYGADDMVNVAHHTMVWAAHFGEYLANCHNARGLKRLRMKWWALRVMWGAFKNGWGKRRRDKPIVEQAKAAAE